MEHEQEPTGINNIIFFEMGGSLMKLLLAQGQQFLISILGNYELRNQAVWALLGVILVMTKQKAYCLFNGRLWQSR